MDAIETDLLIIGAGVAAAALAQRVLDANPARNILILEAGGVVKMRDFALFQNYLASNLSNSALPYNYYWDNVYPEPDNTGGENQSAGQTMIPLQGARLMMYGGSTVHWGGWSFRRKPEDFRLFSNTGRGIDWPLSYEELEPYYGQAESYLGVSGDSRDPGLPRDPARDYPYPAFPYTLEDGLIIDGFKRVGYTYSAMPIARHGVTKNTDSPNAPCQTTGTCKYCPFGARYVAANYLDDMKTFRNYPNFQIRTNVVVNQLDLSAKSRVDGVQAFDKTTGATFLVKAQTVVVAAGAIESPKLLLNSRGPLSPAGVGNGLDLVGRNFVTHPYFVVQASLASNPKALQPEMGFPTLVSRHFDSVAEQAEGKFFFVNPNTSPGVNLASLMQAGNTPQQIKDRVAASAKNPLNVQIQGMLEVFSEPGNFVKPMARPNHVGLPQTIVSYSKASGFDARMDYIVGKARAVFDAIGATNATLQTPVSWRADHASCTTRMAARPEDGVVDRDLKVFGMDNLYVCSNASFSSLGAVNPTLTLAALSLRLGDKLKGA